MLSNYCSSCSYLHCVDNYYSGNLIANACNCPCHNTVNQQLRCVGGSGSNLTIKNCESIAPKTMNLLKRLLSPEDRLLSKYVFNEKGNLDFTNALVQEALLSIPAFKTALVKIVKEKDKKKKNNKCPEEE